MFSRHSRTAAWRLSAWSSLAFAGGTAIAFLAAYEMMAANVTRRGDSWLQGEADAMARVAATQSPGRVHAQLKEEVLELLHHRAPHPPEPDEAGEDLYFFVVLDANGHPETSALLGRPRDLDAVLSHLDARSGFPRSVHLPGWEYSVRLVSRPLPNGQALLVGAVPHDDMELLENVRELFAGTWLATVLLGFGVSWLGVRRVLKRVDRIAETAGQISAGRLDQRIEDPGHGDEIAHLATTFNTMLDRLQAAMQHIRAVADSAAHDLRSPLTLLRGNLESALGSEDEVERTERIASAIEAADRLAALVEASLDVAQADAGALTAARNDVDLTALASAMVELFEPAAHEKGIDLSFEPGAPLHVLGDAELLQRAVGNLLDNAVIHLPAGSHVRVRVFPANGDALLEVVDDGPGFPSSIRDQAFDRGVKSPGSSGRGLGLAIVRAVATAHGGTVSLEQPAAGGSRILVRLPRSRAR